jgi:hypothetical protein
MNHSESEDEMGKVIGRFTVATVEDRGVQTVWDYEKGESAPMPQIAVTLNALTKANDNTDFDNRSFYRSTPQGKIEMVIQNPDAAEHFQTGSVFNVTFEELDSDTLKAEQPSAA